VSDSLQWKFWPTHYHLYALILWFVLRGDLNSPLDLYFFNILYKLAYDTRQVYIYNLMMMFVWVLAPCRLVGRCQRFGEAYCLHLQETKPERCRQHVSPKRWHLSTRFHGPRTQNIVILTAVQSLNLSYIATIYFTVPDIRMSGLSSLLTYPFRMQIFFYQYENILLKMFLHMGSSRTLKFRIFIHVIAYHFPQVVMSLCMHDNAFWQSNTRTCCWSSPRWGLITVF
jgi:hypothetical protein